MRFFLEKAGFYARARVLEDSYARKAEFHPAVKGWKKKNSIPA